ncbi:MAG: ricin-type beta-trefoil lectin domain protein, partial [Pseudomonadota bacterium]
WERVPACNTGLRKDRGRCVRPRLVVCGGLNQRTCKVWERVPACNNGLRKIGGRCVKSVTAPPVQASSKWAIHTAAALAEAAYPKKQKILDRETMSLFPRRGNLVHHSNGFSGGIFEGRRTIYVAFAGSDQLKEDWLGADVQLASWFGKNKTKIKSQIAEAKRLTRRAIANNPQKKRIIVVGHSLGGYLAQVVTAELPVSAGISFNAPGFGPLDRGTMYTPKNSARLMENHSRERDLFGNFGKHFGRKIIYHDLLSAVKLPLKNHDITGFRNDISNGLLPYRTLVSGASFFSNRILRSLDSKKCMQIGKPVTEGKNARIRKCDKKKWNQRWTFRKSGIMHLSSVGGKDAYKPRCLEVRNSKNGAAVQVGECHGLQNQRWIYDKGRIRGKYREYRRMCVDVKGARNLTGTSMILWTCHGKSNQKWQALN